MNFESLRDAFESHSDAASLIDSIASHGHRFSVISALVQLQWTWPWSSISKVESAYFDDLISFLQQ